MIKGLKPYAEYNESGQKWLGRALAPRNGNSIFEKPLAVVLPCQPFGPS